MIQRLTQQMPNRICEVPTLLRTDAKYQSCFAFGAGKCETVRAALRGKAGCAPVSRLVSSTANDRLVAFQRKHPIALLWDKGDKASADMMSLDASRHLYNARLEPRRRTAAAGIYTHVMGSYGVFHDQPIVLNERQAAPAVHGVEDYNINSADGIRLSLLAVDTHGYTNVAMAVAKLLGFDLCVRLLLKFAVSANMLINSANAGAAGAFAT